MWLGELPIWQFVACIVGIVVVGRRSPVAEEWGLVQLPLPIARNASKPAAEFRYAISVHWA
jgi:hypothetical protein